MTMNRAIFWRLLWKECRMLRGFWIALVAFTVVAQLIAVVSFVLLNQWTRDVPSHLFGLAFAMAAFYALGCGAALFAVEREEETYAFLRAQPVSGGQVLAGKLAFALASIVALWAAVYVESTVVCGFQMPDEASTHGILWGTLGLAAIEALTWGMFFSLLLTRPMTAAFAAAGAMVASVAAIAWWVDYRPQQFAPLGGFVVVSFYRVLVLIAVLAADVWLARRWLDETFLVPAGALRWRLSKRPVARREWVARPEAPRVRPVDVERQTTPFVPQSVPPHMTAPRGPIASATRSFLRLVWQSWRQSRLTMLIMTVLGAAFVFWVSQTMETADQGQMTAEVAYIAAFVTVVLTALAGGCAFQGDQAQQRFRFLAERGARPTAIWLSRHLVWLLPVALGAAAAALLLSTVAHEDSYELMEKLAGDFPPREDTTARFERGLKMVLGMSVVVLALGYAAGQFCSMFLRRSVVAGFCGLLLAGGLCCWALLMHWLGVGWLWSVAPIPVVLLFATWLRTPHWLLERTDRRARLSAILSVALPAVALVAAVISFRVYQIPYADPGIDVTDFERRMIVEKHMPIETLQELSASRGPMLALGRTDLDRAHKDEQLGRLDDALDCYFAVLDQSRHLRPAGQMADELENLVHSRLPHWAARPGQTSQRIKGAIDRLRQFYASLPPAGDAIKQEYATAMLRINLDPRFVKHSYGGTPHELRMARLGLALAPWETARARRLLNLVAARDLDAITQVEAAMTAGQQCTDIIWSPALGPLPKALFGTTLFNNYPRWGSRPAADALVSMTARRRATLILLALEAWKADHGELPKTLDELAPAYLDKLPLDPYSGQPFRYLPQGIPGGPAEGVTPWSNIRAGQALIWSTGPHVRFSGLGASGPTYAVISGGDENDWNPLVSEREAWLNGIPFPIP